MSNPGTRPTRPAAKPGAVRTRRVSRQREAGEVTRRETRRRVLQAAAAEFADRGYVGATVARIADRADVAVPTLYSAWGSKRALLRAVMLSAIAGEEADFDADADVDRAAILLGPQRRQPGPDGAGLLVLVAHGIRQVAERSAVGWATYRDAAAVDPDVAADWQALQVNRRETFRQLLATLSPASLRDGMTMDAAIDTAWAVASPETHELFVRRLGWTYDQFETWMATTLVAALIDPAAASQG